MKRDWIRVEINKGNRSVIRRVKMKGGVDHLSDADVDGICSACGYKEKSVDEIAYINWKNAYESYRIMQKSLTDMNRFNGDWLAAISNPEPEVEMDLTRCAEKVRELAPMAQPWAKFLGSVVYEDYLRKCKEV